MDPTLPRELEREIFRLAAVSDRKSVLHLVLVAHRVKIWVEGLLYQTLVVVGPDEPESSAFSASDDGPGPSFPAICVSDLLAMIASRPRGFFQSAVEQICFELDDVEPANAHIILSACSGVTQVFVRGSRCASETYLGPLTALRNLTHLQARAHYLLNIAFDLPPGVFQNITHLELVDRWVRNSPTGLLRGALSTAVLAKVLLIPRLTHIAFELTTFRRYELLFREARLQCIMAVAHGLGPETALRDSCIPKGDDRALVCFRRGLPPGVGLGIDYWGMADDFIAGKRSGAIDGKFYFYCVRETH
ncbi:hypothetical protein DFH06DRAFT_1331415 [Mycena polygramma]|nr:hypothetical protein DFH06DRAFT_1331415 [Mycena polygramma]